MRDSDWLKIKLRLICLICVQTHILCNGANDTHLSSELWCVHRVTYFRTVYGCVSSAVFSLIFIAKYSFAFEIENACQDIRYKFTVVGTCIMRQYMFLLQSSTVYYMVTSLLMFYSIQILSKYQREQINLFFLSFFHVIAIISRGILKLFA